VLTTYQPDPKSNPNPNPTTKQDAIVNIQLNMVTCPTHPDKFIQERVGAPSMRLSIVIVTLQVILMLKGMGLCTTDLN